MTTYRQRPIEIEALFFGPDLNLNKAEKWVRQHGVPIARHDDSLGRPYFTIGLPEGVLEWRWDTWLVKDPVTLRSEFTIYDDATFRAGHEVPEPDQDWPAVTSLGVPAVEV